MVLVLGIGLGFYVAFRLRSVRKQMFEAFKAQEKPVSVVFADGRTGKLWPEPCWMKNGFEGVFFLLDC